MADKKQSLQVQGVPPHSFIWSYEEPENNLELASSVQLADQFLSFINSGISQVFLTTHSPVFYNLHERNGDGDTISCHHIYCDHSDEGTKETAQANDLDDRMGTTALFARVAKEFEERLRERQTARVEAEQLAQANRRKLFVEGLSDKHILRKALNVFAPDRADQIDVETTENGGGHNYVIDMLIAWKAVAKHKPGTRRAAGLVDLDMGAKSAAAAWNSGNGNTRYSKCIKLQTPVHMYPVLEAGFKIPVVLETLYDRAVWSWAEERGYLVDRPPLKSLPD